MLSEIFQVVHKAVLNRLKQWWSIDLMVQHLSQNNVLALWASHHICELEIAQGRVLAPFPWNFTPVVFQLADMVGGLKHLPHPEDEDFGRSKLVGTRTEGA
jgi:hypothetical protein